MYKMYAHSVMENKKKNNFIQFDENDDHHQ